MQRYYVLGLEAATCIHFRDIFRRVILLSDPFFPSIFSASADIFHRHQLPII